MLDEPRFTHLTLPVEDLVTSIEWYERYTPLRAVDHRRDPETDVAWLCHPQPTDHPFVVVLTSFESTPEMSQGRLIKRVPFGHLGIELPSRGAVDAMAVLGRADGCLAWEPSTRPTPVGYVCALTDPDGNVVEFSYDQGVYESVQATLAKRAASAENDSSMTD